MKIKIMSDQNSQSNKARVMNLLGAALVGLPLSIMAVDTEAVSSNDRTFLKEAYDDGLAEVQLAELAKTKATNAEVKKLAEHMEVEHRKANAELKMLAGSKKVELPSTPASAAMSRQKQLERKEGADFDKAFVDLAISEHKTTIKEFEKVAKDTKDADVKAFAERTLPSLRAHLSRSEATQKSVGR